MELLPNHYYHIYNRGNNKEKLFYRTANYEFFLSKYKEHCFHVFETYAYCLMNNHFHLLISTRSKKDQKKLFEKRNLKTKKLRSPSKHLTNFFSSYAQSINRQQGRTGSLFQKNFKRKEIDSDDYFRKLVVYIHQNPSHHNFNNQFSEYPFSSFADYTNKDESFLNREKTLELFGGIENLLEVHKKVIFDR